MVEADRVERAAQAQDDVGPALAAGRAVVEFAEQGALLGLARDISRGCRRWSAGRRCRTRARAGARRRSAAARRRRRRPPRRSPARSGGRGHRARTGRPRAARPRAARRTSGRAPRAWRSPSSLSGTSTSRSCDVDHGEAGRVGGVARDVAGALAVADDPEPFGPSLSHRRNKARAAGGFSRAGGQSRPFGLEPGAQVGGVGEEMRLHAHRSRALDVDLRGRRRTGPRPAGAGSGRARDSRSPDRASAI